MIHNLMLDASNLLLDNPSRVVCNNQLWRIWARKKCTHFWRTWARKMHTPNPWLLCIKICCKIPDFFTLSLPNFNLVVLSPLAFFYCNQLAPKVVKLCSTLPCYVVLYSVTIQIVSFFLQIFENEFAFFLPLLAILDTIHKAPQTRILPLVLPKLGVWSKSEWKQ